MFAFFAPPLSWLLISSAFAAQAPVYRQPPPAPMCTPASTLSKRMRSCEQNQIFLAAAQDCLARVESIRAQVTRDLRAVMSTHRTGGQNQDFQASGANQQEAVAAHAYALAVAETALANLDEYFDTVVLPDDLPYLSDEEVIATPCYHDAVVPMDKIAEQLEDMVDEIKQSQGMEGAMEETSKGRDQDIQAAGTGPVKGGTGQGGAPAAKIPTGKSKPGSSNVTGVEQDLARERKSKKAAP